METLLRWTRRLLLGLGVLALCLGLAYIALHLHTERELKVAPGPELAPLPAGDAVEGARLARVLGCRGCHEDTLGGGVFAEIPWVARLVAPNLTRARANYDDAAFLRLMRTGAKADGTLALVMPNRAHQRLTEGELADLLAFLRAAPAVPDQWPPTVLYPLARLGMVTGEYDLDEMRADPPESPAVLADRNETDRGRHLAQVACSECHGLDFAGYPEDGMPGLVVAKAYSAEEFVRLMRTGTTKAGGESASGLMSGVARSRFSAFTDEEIADLKAFLDRR